MMRLSPVSCRSHSSVFYGVALNRVRGIATAPTCAVCAKPRDALEFQQLRQSQPLYSAGKTFLQGCKEASQDLFSSPSQNCTATRIMRAEIFRMIQDRRRSPENNIIHFNADRARFFPSAFLRELKKPEDTSDRTGEQGYLGRAMVNEHLKLEQFSRVIDLGGQDDSFVKHFSAKRTVVDINIATPFFSTDPSVEYIIDSAIDALKSDVIHRTDECGTRLFAMSNLLNVLLPEEGRELLDTVTVNMRPGDALVITNLARRQFETKTEAYKIVPGEAGLHSVWKGSKFYKTTVVTDLLASWLQERGMDVIAHRETELTLRRSITVVFTTILLRRNNSLSVCDNDSPRA